MKRILVSGCGDSYCAGLCTEQIIQSIAQLPAQAVTAMRLSRYYPCGLLKEELSSTLVIGISNSGRVPRVAEAVTRLRGCGAMTLALTAGAESPLARAAEYVVSTEIPRFEQSPGVRGYVIAMLTITLLAIGIGEKKGLVFGDKALAYEEEIKALFANLVTVLPKYDETAFRLAEHYGEAPSCEFAGAGHGYGSAVFAREKLYEAAGIPSAVSDSEEWFHSFKFLKEQDSTPVMAFLDSHDAGASRTYEMLERMKRMERGFALVTDDREISSAYAFRLPRTENPMLLPLAEFAPPALLASYLAALRREPYSRGFQGRWRDFEGAPSTVVSKMELW